MTIFFRTRGHVYRVERKYIILQISDKEERDKINSMIDRDTNTQWFKINTEHVNVKDTRLLQYVKDWKDIAGMDIICSGIIKKYSFKKEDSGELIEGKTIVARTIREYIQK